ncbi:cytochrome P450 [Amycolatopsis sp. CA-230715]|uniref:cytochrome P450 n=1 Tax=Amycolatopsis sp. CA-230715 TaxID=2745196 RepID=UPI001C01D772|nr:cytochrome P450 [Amycolatopsis sp. CA-230715]QWF84065.1 Epi-isozizaene 5-monooxygenase/(E)-beta-farnesene synthase [Amycolatopsis sp. CA-230715]
MTTTERAPGPALPFGIRRFRDQAAHLMLRMAREHGDVTRFRVGPELMHQVAGPEAIREVLHDNENYRRGRVYEGFELFFGKGLLTTDGEQWRTLRRTGQPMFRANFLHPNAPVITAAVDGLMRRWEGLAARGAPVDIVPEVMRLAFDVVTRVLCDHDLSHRADEVIPAIVHVLSAMFPGSAEQLLPAWLPGRHRRRLRATQAVLDAAVGELLAEHHRGALPADRMVGRLVAAIDRNGNGLTRGQILDELKTHLLAGHETTGCGLAWTLHEIAAHPEVGDRLRAEVTAVLSGRDARELTTSDLAALPYLRQVVAESLRLHPPIPMFPRQPIRDVRVGGYRIPARSTVFVSPLTVHHDPRHWPDPEAFDPGRFDPDGPGPARYTYFPFGGGQRRCIGAPLAELEIQLAVAMITTRFRLRPRQGHPVDPHSLISLRPRSGLPMTISDTVGAR